MAKNQIESLVSDFVNGLTAILHAQALERARDAMLGAFGGREVGNGRSLALTKAGRPRRKLPKQLCPVPGCKNVAAPVFGMVCKDHKDVAKSKLKKYRETRRAKKTAKG